MRGYDATSYGEGIADVYDSWYADEGATATAVDGLAALAAEAGPGPVLELAAGTGRLALPLAARGLEVHALDASAAMLGRLRAKPGAEAVHVVQADMAGLDPPGPFALVFVSFNSFFNLTTLEEQRRCLASVAARLAPGGRFALEAFVPEARPAGDQVEVRRLELDRVVLGVSRHDPDEQAAWGQVVELSEAGGVRLRPWRIRYATPEQLDGLAAEAGLELVRRAAGWDGAAFGPDSAAHVSVYGSTRR